MQTKDNLNVQNYCQILSIWMYAFKVEMHTEYTIYFFDCCRISVININLIFLEIPAIVAFSHQQDAYIEKKSSKTIHAQTLRSARFIILPVILMYNLEEYNL